jgi:hypothetical protein
MLTGLMGSRDGLIASGATCGPWRNPSSATWPPGILDRHLRFVSGWQSRPLPLGGPDWNARG